MNLKIAGGILGLSLLATEPWANASLWDALNKNFPVSGTDTSFAQTFGPVSGNGGYWYSYSDKDASLTVATSGFRDTSITLAQSAMLDSPRLLAAGSVIKAGSYSIKTNNLGTKHTTCPISFSDAWTAICFSGEASYLDYTGTCESGINDRGDVFVKLTSLSKDGKTYHPGEDYDISGNIVSCYEVVKTAADLTLSKDSIIAESTTVATGSILKYKGISTNFLGPGQSSVVPAATDDLASAIKTNRYLSADLKLHASTKGDYFYPFAGLGFNFKEGTEAAVDINSKSGLCLTYKATDSVFLELKNTTASVPLAPATEWTVRNISFTSGQDLQYRNGNTLTVNQILAQTKGLNFRYQNTRTTDWCDGTEDPTLITVPDDSAYGFWGFSSVVTRENTPLNSILCMKGQDQSATFEVLQVGWQGECSTTADPAGTTVLALESFSMPYGQNPNQNDIAADYGWQTYGDDAAWKAGGNWFVYTDAGSTVENAAGNSMATSADLDASVSGGAMHAILNTKSSTETNKFAALAVDFLSDGGSLQYFDFTKLAKVFVRMKGSLSGGSLRVQFRTKDIEEDGWGNYGMAASSLPSTYTDFLIKASDLQPEQYSPAALAKRTWAANGAPKTSGLEFKIGGATKADIYIDSIAFIGLDSTVFGFTPKAYTGSKVYVAPVAMLPVQSPAQNIRLVGSLQSRQLNYMLDKAASHSVRISNINGTVLFAADNIQGASGLNTLALPSFPAGVVFVQITSGSLIQNARLVAGF